VWSIDADQPVIQIRSMDEVVSESIWQTRVSASVLSALAVMALFSAVGIYGVVSYWVSQRTREIGVRIALGASVEDLMRLVIGETLTWVVAGATVGVGGSLAVSRLLVSTLYEVKPTNPAILSMVIALLGGVALMACWIPARRAAKVDPMVALRHE
jgi:putative ABC transport system permease protein